MEREMAKMGLEPGTVILPMRLTPVGWWKARRHPVLPGVCGKCHEPLGYRGEWRNPDGTRHVCRGE